MRRRTLSPKDTGKYKVALVGGGINSAVGSAHYSAINLSGSFEIVAGNFSQDRKINAATAQAYSVSRSRNYCSLDELIQNEKECIDVVVVLTPTNIHASQVIQLIENGIPVICEKALACSVQEVVDIQKVLKTKNGFLVVTYNYLGYPMIRELKHMIANDRLGKLRHIQIEMPQEGFIRSDKHGKPVVPQKWRLEDGVIPTLSLDLGVHLHMFIQYLTEEQPLAVVARSESIGHFSQIIDNVNCILEYTNGLTCNMWYSKIATGNRNGMKIRFYGEKGSAEWVQEIPEILHIACTNGKRCTIDRGCDDVHICNQSRYTRFKVGHPAGFIEAYANYYHDIASALAIYKKTGEMVFDNCFGAEEALVGMKLFEAVEKSCISRSWKTV